MDPNRRPLTSRDYRWVQALAGWLARKGVSANGISIAGMVFATIGAALLVATSPDPEAPFSQIVYACRLGEHGFNYLWSPPGCALGAAVCIQLRLLCNLLDGLVAVEGGRKGKAGALFNEAPDRYADVVLLATAGYAADAPWLGWMAATFAVATAYARAFGASLGLGQDFCGPFAKQQRMFFLTAGTIAACFTGQIPHQRAFAWTLLLIAIGTLFTFLRRIVRIYRQLP